jgi:thioredoxin reductase (NADPH)
LDPTSSKGSELARIAIVGDGPGGLAAALFLSKNGHEVTVFGTDQTAMNYAYLHNYLGIPEIAGTEFQRIAKDQVSSFGASLVNEEVEDIGDGFEISTASATIEVDYLILSEGKGPKLAKSIGLVVDQWGAIQVDRDYRSSKDRVYVIGRSARPERSQAIISAGAGATAALDILALESGHDVQDWDTPPDA